MTAWASLKERAEAWAKLRALEGKSEEGVVGKGRVVGKSVGKVEGVGKSVGKSEEGSVGKSIGKSEGGKSVGKTERETAVKQSEKLTIRLKGRILRHAKLKEIWEKYLENQSGKLKGTLGRRLTNLLGKVRRVMLENLEENLRIRPWGRFLIPRSL